ncbi:hypothetical protein ZW41_04530 [Salmonella enterica subsp. enterica]|nr:hypothetical protein [Salmonella enterica subsp. enterica]
MCKSIFSIKESERHCANDGSIIRDSLPGVANKKIAPIIVKNKIDKSLKSFFFVFINKYKTLNMIIPTNVRLAFSFVHPANNDTG